MSEELPPNVTLAKLDDMINWGRKNSLWPMFFGLSCCFVEMMASMTPRFDLSRFGAEVLRGSPREADLMIISGTPFKKMGEAILRLWEQMPNPKWVIAMGSCANSGGMYDVYSVIQGVNQILPVDVYIPGCPPRPEAVIQGLITLQKKIATEEQPTRKILGLSGGSEGTSTPVLIDGISKSRDPRGPGYGPAEIRGSSQQHPVFTTNRDKMTWRPPQPKVFSSDDFEEFYHQIRERFSGEVHYEENAADMPTLRTTPQRLPELLRYLKNEAQPSYRRLEDITAIDERARRQRPGHDFTLIYHLLSFERRGYLRVRVPLRDELAQGVSIVDIWPNANWYEREIFDMFGITFNRSKLKIAF